MSAERAVANKRSGARRSALAVAVLATVIPLASCGLTDVSMSSSGVPAPAPAATLVFTPALGANDVLPGSPISITATQGRLSSVKVVTADGTPLSGVLSMDARRWVSSEKSLGYGSQYLVEVTAVDRDGVTSSTREQFSTLVPKETASVAYISPEPGTEFGVGMPLSLHFDHDVKNKAEVEKSLQVVTPKPIAGAWRWVSDSQLEYRPEKYWPGNIPITVRADLEGVQFSDTVWGTDKVRTFEYRTSDAIVGKVDMDAHTLVVRRNGKVIREIPITTGKPGFETRSGIKVVMSKERNRIMDAATGGTSQGDPEYYRLNVEYAMRLTWTGEFLHAAPWSEGSQGYANVSHGCTGMSTENAAWLYDMSNVGDVYEYTGNDKMLTDNDNGITVWNSSWKDWVADSAAGPQMTVTS